MRTPTGLVREQSHQQSGILSDGLLGMTIDGVSGLTT